jgi:hypothetical protein
MFLLNLSPVQYEQVYWIAFCLCFTLFFQTSYFFYLKNVGTSFKMLTLASNRTEAKLVSDISFVVVLFQKMHYYTIINGDI